MKRSATVVVLLSSIAVLAGASVAAAQMPPDSFTNLKVLPKNITRDQLLATMRSFTGALGVRCDYCHVQATPAAGAPAQGPPRMNFAADDKAQKRIARGMLQMVQGINGEYLAKIADLDEPRIQVRCITCHHGAALPRTLTDVLAEDVTLKSVAAAIQDYKQLKATYYGSGAYDFREGSLDDLARQLTTAGKVDDALAILDLAGQEFPQSGMVPFLQGEALLQKGDKPGAIEKYKRALELQPQNPQATRRLRELGAS